MLSYIHVTNQLFDVLAMARDNVSNALINSEYKKDYAFNYLSLEITDKSFQLGAIPNAKLNEVIQKHLDYYDNPHRRIMRPVALLTKLFGTRFSNKELTEWADHIKLLLHPPPTTFTVVKGDDILTAYAETSYSNDISGSSTLHKSCMRYNRCAKFFNVYTKNPEHVAMLVGERAGKVVSRALIWTAEWFNWFEPTNDYKRLLDRPYFLNELEHVALLKAGEQHCDYFRNHGRQVWIDYKAEGHYKDIKGEAIHFRVPIDINDHTPVPYIDTFRYAYDGALHNMSAGGLYKGGQLTGTEGAFSGLFDKQTLEEGCIITANTKSSQFPLKYCSPSGFSYVRGNIEVPCGLCGYVTTAKNINYRNSTLYCDKHVLIPDANGKFYCTRHQIIRDTEQCDYCDGILGHCYFCGARNTPTNQKANGHVVCAHCLNNTLVNNCFTCATRISRLDNTEFYSECLDNVYCSDCYTELHTHCVGCDNELLRDYQIVYGGENYCEECIYDQAPTCAYCESYIADNTEVTRNVDGWLHTLCTRCNTNNVTVCEECDVAQFARNMNGTVCNRCTNGEANL